LWDTRAFRYFFVVNHMRFYLFIFFFFSPDRRRVQRTAIVLSTILYVHTHTHVTIVRWCYATSALCADSIIGTSGRKDGGSGRHVRIGTAVIIERDKLHFFQTVFPFRRLCSYRVIATGGIRRVSIHRAYLYFMDRAISISFVFL